MRDPSMERARKMMGYLAKDVVTGFTGVVTAVVEHAYGCAHIVIEPEKVGDNRERMKGYGFDEPRIEVIEQRNPGVKITEPTYKVGYILEDAINGQKGVVSSVTTWLFGTPDYGLEPIELKPDGSVDENFFLPEARAKLVRQAAPQVVPEDKPETPKKSERKPRTGGPKSAAPDRRRGCNF